MDLIVKSFKKGLDLTKPEHSFYRVETDEDSRLVAFVLDALRDQPSPDHVDFVAFSQGEVRMVVEIADTKGETYCDRANRMHRDFVMDESAVRKLCEQAIKAGRQVVRFGKAAMKEYRTEVEAGGCWSSGAAKVGAVPCRFAGCMAGKADPSSPHSHITADS
ncbi:MAG: hypothetical protein K2W96_22960 [Gemmataceae bacterium]|nr:hypothetical protein [Gemmataceae bacterium]